MGLASPLQGSLLVVDLNNLGLTPQAILFRPFGALER